MRLLGELVMIAGVLIAGLGVLVAATRRRALRRAIHCIYCGTRLDRVWLLPSERKRGARGYCPLCRESMGSR